MSAVALGERDRAALAELAPLLERAAGLDARAVARLRLSVSVATALVRLPFGVLVSRSVPVDALDAASAARSTDAGSALPGADAGGDADADHGRGAGADAVRDVSVRASELLEWLGGTRAELPPARDLEWRTGLPPQTGWRRLDDVPDTVIRPLVREGALTLKQAAAREGVPGAQPRQEVADALLDSVVLQVSGDGGRADVTLRALSALTRMGFLPRGGRAHVDVAGRWVRVVAAYGTVLLDAPAGPGGPAGPAGAVGLTVLRR